MRFLHICILVVALAATLSAQKQPDFAARGMDGQMIDTAALRGKVVVINL